MIYYCKSLGIHIQTTPLCWI